MSPTLSSVAGVTPPRLHWLLLLLIDLATLGIFSMIWCFVQAKFARKVTGSRAALWYALWLVLLIATSVIEGLYPYRLAGKLQGLAYGLISIACLLCYQVGNFSVKNAVESYYSLTGGSEKPLNGLMTIIFGQVYLQYHMDQLRKAQV